MAQDITLVLRVDDKGTRVIQTFSRSTKDAFTGMEKSVRRTTKSLEATARKLGGVGKSLTKFVTLPLALLGAAAIKASFDFNKGMANVATLIPGNIDRVKELGLSVQDMAMTFGKSTSDVTGGLYQVISAFGDTADTVKILEINVKAAAAGMATTTEAIALTSAVTKGYGDTSAAAVEKVADLAFITVKLGQTTFPELASAIGRVVPLATKMNVSMEEMFAVYATLTGVTGKAAEVTTQFAGILKGFMKPTKDMEIAMGKIERAMGGVGYTSAELMIKELGVVEAMRRLEKTTDGSAKAIAKLLPVAEALVAWFALTGAQADTFNEKMEAMREGAGTLEEAFKEISEGVNKTGFAFAQVKVSVIVLAQKIGDELAPSLGKLLAGLKPIIMKMMDLVKGFAEAPRFIKLVVGGFLALALAAGPALIVTSKLLAAIIAFRKAEVSTRILTGLAGAFKSLTVAGVAAKAVKALTVSLVGVKVVMTALLGPLGLLIAALGATIHFTNKVRDAQKGLIEAEEREMQMALLQSQRWVKVAKEAGLTTREMMAMTRAYKSNYSEMFRAIKLGEEGEKIQKAYIKTIKILKGEMKELSPGVKDAMGAILAEYKTGKFELDEMIKSVQFFIAEHAKAGQEVPDSLTKILEGLQKQRDAIMAEKEALRLRQEAWDNMVASYQTSIPTMSGVLVQFDAMKEAMKNLEAAGADTDAMTLVFKESITSLYEAAKTASEVFGVDMPEDLETLYNSLTDTEKAARDWAAFERSMGIVSIEDKAKAVEAVRDRIKQMTEKYKEGWYTLADYSRVVRILRKELEELSTTVGETALPAARDFGDVVEKALASFKPSPEFKQFEKELTKAEAWDKQLKGIEKFEEKLREVSEFVGMVTGAWDAMWSQIYENQIARIDNEYEKRKQVIDASLMSDQEKYFAIEKLDREMDKRRLSAMRKQAMATKVSSIIEAIMNTAVAVTAALKAGFILGPIMAGIIGAMGAVQVALIAAQPLPALAEGGIIGLHGPEIYLGGEKGVEVVRPIAEDRAMMAGAAPTKVLQATFTANFIISSPDALGVRDFVRDKAGPEFISWVKLNKTELLEALDME